MTKRRRITWSFLFVWLCLCLSANAQPNPTWADAQKLLPDDAHEDQWFGASAAILDHRLVIGAPEDVNFGDGPGAAYVFERTEFGGWVQAQKLTASDGKAEDQFGDAVAIHAGTIVVGAPDASDNGTSAGASYVFEVGDDGGWVEVQKLLAPDGKRFDDFGGSVSIADGIVAVGARSHDSEGTEGSGAVYLYETNDAGVWTLQQKLFAPDGGEYDSFGQSVALAPGVTMVGAYKDDDGGSESGSVYVFERANERTWTLVQKLVALDAQVDDWFGYALSIDENRVLVGLGLGDDDIRRTDRGPYLFEQGGDGVWRESDRLEPVEGVGDGDCHSCRVALSGSYALVGAGFGGYAYLYEEQAPDEWRTIQRLEAPDRLFGERFGFAVALAGSTGVVGAYSDDDPETGAGSAYVFVAIAEPQIAISGSCPGEMTFEISEASPSASITIARGPAEGETSVSTGRCAGLTLDIEEAEFVTRVATNDDGTHTLVRTIPAAICGQSVQVVDNATCGVGPPAQIPVE